VFSERRWVCTVVQNNARNAQPKTTNATYLILSPAFALHDRSAAARGLIPINDRRSAGEQRKSAAQEHQNVSHDTICEMIVVTAMPVVKTKARIITRKIVFMTLALQRHG
jgi:hypothetical protein